MLGVLREQRLQRLTPRFGLVHSGRHVDHDPQRHVSLRASVSRRRRGLGRARGRATANGSAPAPASAARPRDRARCRSRTIGVVAGAGCAVAPRAGMQRHAGQTRPGENADRASNASSGWRHGGRGHERGERSERRALRGSLEADRGSRRDGSSARSAAAGSGDTWRIRCRIPRDEPSARPAARAFTSSIRRSTRRGELMRSPQPQPSGIT